MTPEEHKPEKGIYASNILHHVSAAELKAADMIKLPVILRGRSDPRETIGDAIAWLDELTGTAGAEEKATGEFIRPVMLIQAEPKSKDRPTVHAEEVKKLLIEDFRVPETHIAIATGDSKGFDCHPSCFVASNINIRSLFKLDGNHSIYSTTEAPRFVDALTAIVPLMLRRGKLSI